jgi:predicted dienelactone hydrolase
MPQRDRGGWRAGAAVLGLALVAASVAPAAVDPPARAHAVAQRPCGRAAADLARPGPYRVATARRTLSGAEGAARPLEVTGWFPAASRCRSSVIVFSHGNTDRPALFARLLTHLASEGFVVLAAQHDDGPAGGGAAQRRADVRVLLDHPAVVADRLAPGLGARIDAARIGVGGHSLGAKTAAELAGRDRRIRAVLLFAGGTTAGPPEAIRAPTLAVAGSADTTVPADRVRRFAARVPAATPHGFLLIRDADHHAYDDRCVRHATCAIVATYATSLFLTYLDGLRAAGAPLDPHRRHDPRVVLRTTRMPPGR